MLTVWQAISPRAPVPKSCQPRHLEVVINTLLIRANFCGSKPDIPIDRVRNRIFTLWAVQALRPDRAIGPNVQFSRRSDDSRLDHFHGAAKSLFRASLIAHLSGEIFFLCQRADNARLVDCLHQRFLAKSVLAHLHRANGRDSVIVIGNGNGHRVDARAKLIEQFSIVLEFLYVRRIWS